jgi:hypothetical protein
MNHTNWLFEHYYCTTYREGTHQGDFQAYLFINRRDTDKRVTSFRMYREAPYWLILKYNAQWDTYAPLIIEYCVNDLKIDNIYLEELYDGN